MNTKNNTVLITGGASGIGLALAQRFSGQGSKVIICGRRKEQLEEAKRVCPELITIRSDVSVESERLALFEKTTKEFPNLNVLINNAGIQNRLPHLTERQDWKRHQQELEINLAAPMHLSMLFVPHLKNQKSAAIMNVSSGLAFSPISWLATYCATKAALHSFTLSLRHQLKDTSVQVFEIIPPAVNTDLGGKGLHDEGAPLQDFANHAFAHIEKGDLEFGFESSETRRRASRDQIDEIFAKMNR